MPALMKVFRRVTAGRVVAAGNVSALETKAQVQPPGPGGQAFFASRGRSRLNGNDLGKVYATISVHMASTCDCTLGWKSATTYLDDDNR
jgi:hypothetical protein